MVSANDLVSLYVGLELQSLAAYVLDDQGRLRTNVVAFVDGRRCRDRALLDDPLRPDSTIHILQALSGG